MSAAPPSLKIVHLDGQMHRVQAPATFEDLSALVQRLFDSPAGRMWCLKYLDEEGDLVSLGSEPEWQEALRTLPSGGACLKLFVHEQRVRERAESLPGQDEEGGFLLVDVDTLPSPHLHSPASRKPPSPALDQPQDKPQEKPQEKPQDRLQGEGNEKRPPEPCGEEKKDAAREAKPEQPPALGRYPSGPIHYSRPSAESYASTGSSEHAHAKPQGRPQFVYASAGPSRVHYTSVQR